MELMIRGARCLLIGVLQTVVLRVLQRLQQTDKKVCYFSRTCDHPEVETVCIGVGPLALCGNIHIAAEKNIRTLPKRIDLEKERGRGRKGGWESDN